MHELYSDEYEFDANGYQKWHLDYRFNLDASASIANHECENYASKNKWFLEFSAKDLFNKSIWIFSPIELAKDFILHYETIHLQQPDSMTAVIRQPKLNTPGSDYKNLVKKNTSVYIRIPLVLIYFLGSLTILPLRESAFLLVVPVTYSYPTN